MYIILNIKAFCSYLIFRSLNKYFCTLCKNISLKVYSPFSNKKWSVCIISLEPPHPRHVDYFEHSSIHVYKYHIQYHFPVFKHLFCDTDTSTKFIQRLFQPKRK